MFTEKIKSVLDDILEQFKNGKNIPEAIAYTIFPVANLPSSSWSLFNRIIVLFSDTSDARGYRQWQAVNRQVKKGSKAIYILVPWLKKKEDEKTKEEKEILFGFMSAPVFRVEDTEGEPLAYQNLTLPDLPLIDRAKEWGISVNAVPGNYEYYGRYMSSKKEISLATTEEIVFWHELCHCADDKLRGGLKQGQDPEQEIIAELSAQALCRLVGKTSDKYLGNSYQYIESYAKQLKLSPHSACLKLINNIEKVLNLVLKGGNDDSS
jgi:hypothetical protein